MKEGPLLKLALLLKNNTEIMSKTQKKHKDVPIFRPVITILNLVRALLQVLIPFDKMI